MLNYQYLLLIFTYSKFYTLVSIQLNYSWFPLYIVKLGEENDMTITFVRKNHTWCLISILLVFPFCILTNNKNMTHCWKEWHNYQPKILFSQCQYSSLFSISFDVTIFWDERLSRKNRWFVERLSLNFITFLKLKIRYCKYQKNSYNDFSISP